VDERSPEADGPRGDRASSSDDSTVIRPSRDGDTELRPLAESDPDTLVGAARRPSSITYASMGRRTVPPAQVLWVVIVLIELVACIAGVPDQYRSMLSRRRISRRRCLWGGCCPRSSRGCVRSA
jgi:hypothetical protein